jgi:hypothetical protein
MTIITLDLSSASMTNNNGVYSEVLQTLQTGQRIKIIDIISLVSISNASVSPFMYLYSNLIQNNSFDTLTNSTTNCIQALDLVNYISSGGVSTYYTDSQNFQFESVLQNTITIERRTGINRTLYIDNAVDFHIRISLEIIDENK